MQNTDVHSLKLFYSESLLSRGCSVNLTWSNGMVDLTADEQMNSYSIGDKIFSIQASAIKKCLIADGESSLYLWIGDKKYQLGGGLMQMAADAQERQGAPGAFVADTIINEASDLLDNHSRMMDFQNYLRHYGVKTQKSSLLKIIAITFLAFLIVFAAAVALLIFSVRSSTSFK